MQMRQYVHSRHDRDHSTPVATVLRVIELRRSSLHNGCLQTVIYMSYGASPERPYVSHRIAIAHWEILKFAYVDLRCLFLYSIIRRLVDRFLALQRT